MTPAHLTKIIQIAGAIALEPPMKRKNDYTPNCYVPWDLIIKLRAALKEAGIDWEDARRKLDAIEEAERQERKKRLDEFHYGMSRNPSPTGGNR